MKVLVLGAGGLVGYKLSNLLIAKGYQFFGTYNMRNPQKSGCTMKLDIMDYANLKNVIDTQNPDVLVNCCSLTNVDYCESHPDEAKKLNVELVSKLQQYCTQIGTKLVHISTDSVFDGRKKSPYVEDDSPNPINVYGRTKLESEKIVLQHDGGIIVRVGVLYGWLPRFISQIPSSSRKSNNFGQWLIEQLRSSRKVNIITDEISSPILADDVANAILHLIIHDHKGLFHLSPRLLLNRYDFALKIAERLLLDKSLISPTTTKELGRNVITAFNKCLDSSKIVGETNFRFMNLDESLDLLSSQIHT